MFVCGKGKGQISKNISYRFLISRSVTRKLGLGRDESSKKHWFLPGSKVKKSFSTFVLSVEKNGVLVQRSTVQK